MKSSMFVTVGVKSLDEKGEMVGSAQSTMIPITGPIGEQETFDTLAQALAVLLPTLASQATNPIAPLDLKLKPVSAEMIEKLAGRLRAETPGPISIYMRTDRVYDEIRILVERKKPDGP